jgi:hypothetical protein
MAGEPLFDTLLDLDGTVGVIDEGGYWVKFNVTRVPVTAEQPHGLDYELTLHDPSDSTMRTLFRNGQVRAVRRMEPGTTGTASRRSAPMNTATLRRC